jgi:hypothetical protein
MLRYRTEPVRNAKTNSLFAELVRRVGAEEAGPVAAFFVGSNRGLYVASTHAVDLLIRDAEGLRAQWARGIASTDAAARQADRTSTIATNIETVRREIADESS